METNIYVTYSDGTRSSITSWFASPQDGLPNGAPANYGVTSADDPLWKAFYDAQPEISRQYLPTPAE